MSRRAVDIACEYLDLGLLPIPVRPRSKVPIEPGWQNLNVSTAEVGDYFGGSVNIGVALGKQSNVADVDLDSPESLAVAPLLLPETKAVFGRPSAPSSHRLYRSPGATTTKFFDPRRQATNKPEAMLVELRSTGAQTVMPGSVHPSGESIEWSPGATPEFAEVDAVRLTDAVARVAAAALLGRYWPNKARHAAALALSGGLYRAGWGPEEMGPFIRAVCAAAQDEETDDRLRANADTATRVASGDPSTGFPRLAEIVGADIVACISKWLRLIVGTFGGSPDGGTASKSTDLGNARRFAADHSHVLRYISRERTWLTYGGNHWHPDEDGRVFRLARETVRKMEADATACKDDDKRLKLLKHAVATEAESRLKAMVALAESEPELACTAERFDNDPWLLNVQNGTLDLRACTIREHRPTDHLTHRLDVPYHPDAVCPTWLNFLDDTFEGDTELIGFVQRAVGYSLTGSTREQVLFLCYGTGQNGKSTFLETILALQGPLATSARFESFMLKRNDQIPEDIARLRGKRFVTASEAEGERRLSEATVKQLTGGDTVTARVLYKGSFSFKPQFKLWLACNHKPVIRGTDYGIWRRVRMIPFAYCVPNERRDDDLSEKLKLELPGILAWAVEGCREWQLRKLGSCSAVDQATASYRDEQDIVRQFVDEKCAVTKHLTVAKGDLYQSYQDWCAAGNERPISKKAFGQRIAEIPGVADRTDTAGSTRLWLGIGFKERS